jgi:predicted nucleic acid-binding protein
MRVVFADTFYYFALLSSRDSAHARAVEFTRDYDGRMVTTGWVLGELADGLAPGRNRKLFVDFLAALRSDPQVTIVPPDSSLFEEGLALYAARPDKDWSLTDCISFCVMKREGIDEALTGDHHFEQAGFRILLK